MIRYSTSEPRGAAMPAFDSQIMTLFSLETFRQMAQNQIISYYQFNFITKMLIDGNIPFDISFTSSTRKAAAALQLTIHVNPTATMVFVVALEPGASVFTPSP